MQLDSQDERESQYDINNYNNTEDEEEDDKYYHKQNYNQNSGRVRSNSLPSNFQKPFTSMNSYTRSRGKYILN